MADNGGFDGITVTESLILAKLDLLIARVDALALPRTEYPAPTPQPGQLSPKVMAMVARRSAGMPPDVRRKIHSDAVVMSLEGMDEDKIVRAVDVGTESTELAERLAEMHGL